MDNALDTVAAGSGLESVQYLNDVIGMVLTVALAASLVAVAIATARWMVFQGGERDGGRALTSRWLHVAGALLAMCIVYNGANALYSGLKENDLSNQIANEAKSGNRNMWVPSNMNEIVENAPDLGVYDFLNSVGNGIENAGNASNPYIDAAAYDAQQKLEDVKNGAAQGAGSATAGSTSGKTSAGAGKSSTTGSKSGKGKTSSHSSKKCSFCGKTYKTKAKAAKCAQEDQKKLAAKSIKGADSSNKYTVKTKKGEKVYICAKCGKEQKSAYLAEYCYSIYPESI